MKLTGGQGGIARWKELNLPTNINIGQLCHCNQWLKINFLNAWIYGHTWHNFTLTNIPLISVHGIWGENLAPEKVKAKEKISKCPIFSLPSLHHCFGYDQHKIDDRQFDLRVNCFSYLIFTAAVDSLCSWLVDDASQRNVTGVCKSFSIHSATTSHRQLQGI